MKKMSIGLWQMIGFGVTALAGSLLHYFYVWSNGSLWVAGFSAVNESTWEHMKLAFYPMFIFAIIESFFFKEYGNFWLVKLKGTLIALILIPVIFYTYGGVIGTPPAWVNILIFFIALGTAFLYEAKQLKYPKAKHKSELLPFVGLCVIFVLFVLFTFFPPHIGIFKDPITGNYGI